MNKQDKEEINLKLVPINDKLDAILVQVKETNGRVRKHEISLGVQKEKNKEYDECVKQSENIKTKVIYLTTTLSLIIGAIGFVLKMFFGGD